MSGDLIDRMFSSEGPLDEDDFFPGSKRKRSPAPDVVETDFWRETYTTKTVQNVQRRFYTIGAIADALQVHPGTVRRWTNEGRIPQAPYRLPVSIVHGETHQGRRLYTEPMIDALVKAFASRGLLAKSRVEWGRFSDLTLEVHEAWSKIYSREKAEYKAATTINR